jgi:pyruvate dehydrogenase E2 component (dihydrolipoamide acetyltransferase)/2-oxoglutarate dehydrogenase E2 component (dihydrolipoamide succinyltransferase)
MAEPIIMPKLAMAMQEGTVVEWLAEEGEAVEKGQVVMNVETEKVVHECEAPASGYLHIIVEAGQTVPVFEHIALLALTKEELTELQNGNKGAPEPSANLSSAPTLIDTRPAKKGRIIISPVAKKISEQHNLDFSEIDGTGPGGRIVKADIEKAIAERETSIPTPTAEMSEGRRVKTSIPLMGMRKTIAKHMHNSLAVAAQMSKMVEIDMTEMIHLREALLEKESEIGTRISYTDLFVFTLAKAVQHFPIVNSSLIGDEIKVWEDINIGVAVALDKSEYVSGLIVPVVKNADKKSLSEISLTIKDLGARARSGELTPEDVTGGTITLSNIGMFTERWIVTTPIINQPESVIVQPGAIVEQPKVVEGQVLARPMMTLNITFDHQIVDGVPIIRFVNKIADLIENPALLHL